MFKKIVALLIVLFSAICAMSFVYAAEGSAVTTESSVQQDTLSTEEEMIPAEEGMGEGVVTGQVTLLDTASSTIAVKADDGAEKSFSVVDGETILWKGVEDVKLTDIKKDDKVEIGYYTNDAGKLIASWVDVIVPEETTAPLSTVPAPATEPASSNAATGAK